MKNCRLTIEMKDGKILIQAEKAGMQELAEMIMCLEQSVGLADIKCNMLDIHLAAMDALTYQVIRERGGGYGS